MITHRAICAAFGAGFLRYAAEVENNPNLKTSFDLSAWNAIDAEALREYERAGYEWARDGGYLQSNSRKGGF